MSIILELRNHVRHGGTQLVNTEAEDLLLANVFGVIKNVSWTQILNPWLSTITGLNIENPNWSITFWQKQRRPIGISEGNTTVDLVIESDSILAFLEVKLHADASSGTIADPTRNQLTRNLDVGFSRANGAQKQFALIYLTADASEPAVVKSTRDGKGPYPVNSAHSPAAITSCLHWASWASIGATAALAYRLGSLGECERGFTRDMLAYLAKKGLWENNLPYEPDIYENKLYRSLRDDAHNVPIAQRTVEPYQEWRGKQWQEPELRSMLKSLRLQDRALLKLLSEHGGLMREDMLFQKFPPLRGKNTRTLLALKAHVNRECKQRDRAPILANGVGRPPARLHQVHPGLGEMRSVVLEAAASFDIDWQLLEPADAFGHA
jgi:hypothetical protein